MITILNSSIILYMIFNIIYFIKIIKNNNNMIQVVVLPILAFVFSLISLGFLLNQDVGLECLIQEFFVVVNFIIMVISLKIGLVKKNKNIEANKTNKSNKKVLLMLFILIIPLIMSFSAFLIEVNIIKKGEIIFIYNYKNGIIQSDYYTYVANENNVSFIDIGHENIEEYTNINLEKKDYIYYYLNYNNETDEYKVEKNYVDKELEKYDKELINQILEDAKDNHYKNKELSHVSICKLDECKYYIVELNGKEFLYKGKKYIGEIKNSSGNISEVFLIKK